MPVSRQDFDRGATAETTETKVLEFLRANPQNAYTAEEIAMTIGHPTAQALAPTANEVDRIARSLEKAAFVSHLGLLVLTRKISSRLVQTAHGPSPYFAAKKPR